MDPMRDLSVSDSRSDSSSSPPLLPSSASALHNAQAFWAQNLGEQSSFQFSSMMYPNLTSQMASTNSSTSTQLHQSTTSSSSTTNPFDFSSAAAAQQQYLYQAASYNPWAYQAAAYTFPYQGMYGSENDFKDVTLTTTARSSAASTPTASIQSLPWTMSHEGKKKRQPYKKDQISRLEYEYSGNPYLTNKRRAELSVQLMLDEKQVKVWFQNRRMKDKKLKQRIAGPLPMGPSITPSFEGLIN